MLICNTFHEKGHVQIATTKVWPSLQIFSSWEMKTKISSAEITASSQVEARKEYVILKLGGQLTFRSSRSSSRKNLIVTWVTALNRDTKMSCWERGFSSQKCLSLWQRIWIWFPKHTSGNLTPTYNASSKYIQSLWLPGISRIYPNTNIHTYM